MNLLNSIPQNAIFIVRQCLVPLFILFNVVGWMGLPGREASRSPSLPSPEETAALGRSVWAAWQLGVLLALVGIAGGYRFFNPELQNHSFTLTEGVLGGVTGLLLGIGRGIIPRSAAFRNQSALMRRRILAFLIVGAVAVSIASGVFYYNSFELVRGLIAAGYTGLLIGYAATFVFEVGK